MYLPSDSRTDPRVQSLRLLFRGLHAFRSFYESDGIFEITAPNGSVWSLFDVEYLYKAAMRRPAKIDSTQSLAEDIQVGDYIQNGGGWQRVVRASVNDVGVATLGLSNDKSKRCAGSTPLAVIDVQQKQLIDYDRDHPCLPLRQQQAIELFLVLNLPEDEAALAMGLARTNPVGMYATSGLTRLLKLMDTGYLGRFADNTQKMLMVG